MATAIGRIFNFFAKCRRAIEKVNNITSNWMIFRRENICTSGRVIINGRLRVKNNGQLIIGDMVRINSEFDAVPICHADFTHFHISEGAIVRIGDGVGISNSIIYAMESVEIQRDAFIGGGCLIYDTDFHSVNLADRILHENEINIKCSPVVISKGAFIGAQSIILKGVVVGENSIVAAGSLVCKSIPKNELWGGRPAKKIRDI
jgi:acetyltransferase-like isoleucine patch superfamily enzyme